MQLLELTTVEPQPQLMTSEEFGFPPNSNMIKKYYLGIMFTVAVEAEAHCRIILFTLKHWISLDYNITLPIMSVSHFVNYSGWPHLLISKS